MQSTPELYPAIHIIFTLLNAIRRGIAKDSIWREFRRQRIALKPRLAFWLAICKQAKLLDETEGQLRVTRQARQWLNRTAQEQTVHLLEAWQNAPKNPEVRQFRKKLLWKLKYNKPLTAKDRKSTNGLKALGLYGEEKLTRWGEYFIKEAGTLPTPKPTPPCTIQEENFIAPLSGPLDLLWQIEQHLRPSAPCKYPLTKKALQFHHGDPHELITLLERGMKAEIPSNTKAAILQQPSIRITEGIVLEFSSPAELAQLRRQPVIRKYIEEFLSSQRILVSNQKAKSLFKMLSRRGVYVHRNEEQPEVSRKRTHFPQNAILQPVGKSVPKLVIIEKYKQLGQALEILYRTPGYPAEKRRITPLIIETRGEQTYVIAYCQTRRGQRTFRLDRMEVPGTY